MIVAYRASRHRRTLAAFVTDTVSRLSMTETGFAQADQPAMPALAAAYTDAVPPARKMRPVPSLVAASGNVASTPPDAVRAAHGIFRGDLVTPASRTALTTVRWPAEDYALGGRVHLIDGQAWPGKPARSKATALISLRLRARKIINFSASLARDATYIYRDAVFTGDCRISARVWRTERSCAPDTTRSMRGVSDRRAAIAFLIGGNLMRRYLTVVAMAFASATPAFADTLAPATAGNAQGPAPIRYYGTGGSETQQIYSSTYFTSPVLINAVSFRAYPGATPSGFFSNSVTVSDAMVRLATTGISANEASGLQPSTNFAANLGAAFTTVYSGSLTLTTAATGSGAQPFDYTINFSTPFAYLPSGGNLLLDVLIPSTATVSGAGFGFLTFDNVNTLNDGVRSIVNVNAAAATGTLDTSAAITLFRTSAVIGAVPEPATWAMLLFGFGLVGASLRRRKISTAVTIA